MAEPAGRQAVAAEHNVSRETLQKLDILVNELGRWQKIKARLPEGANAAQLEKGPPMGRPGDHERGPGPR